MGRPFILSKSTRRPLKKVKGRTFPSTPADGNCSNDSRTPSPLGMMGGLEGEKGGPSGGMDPGFGGRERALSQTESEPADESGRGGGKPLPVKSTPGALRDVDFGGGSQAKKNARRESVSRRRQQSESPLAGQAKTNIGRTFKRPTKEEETKFHFALLTPLGDSMLSKGWTLPTSPRRAST